jgi:type I restriction enzyme S subunit
MRIKDICSGVTDGSHNPPQGLENSDYLMLSSKNVFDDKITFDSPRYLSQIDFEQESKRTRIKSGDVLLTIVGTVGRAAVVGENMPQFTLQRSVAVLHPNVEICDSRYLMYALQANRNHIESRAKGVAQKGIYLKEVADIELQIPLLSEQTHRVKVLDKIAFVIKFHQKQLQKLDELVKARFVEMFGDCKSMVSMNKLCSIITDGTHQPPRFQESGIPFIFVSNLVGNVVTYNAEKFISEDTYAELYKRTPIEIGDLLLSTVGSYGHPAVVTEDRKFLFQRHIAYLKPRHNMVNSFYLHSALLAPDGQRQIEEKVKGIAQKTLNLSEIKKIVVPLPTIEEQNQFEKFVNQTDKSKVAVQKSLDEAQLLFDSLMQQYFG